VQARKCKKTGADAVAEVTPRRPANVNHVSAFQELLKPDT